MSDKISQFDLNMLQVYPFLLGAISFDYYRTYLYLSTYVHLNNYSIEDLPSNYSLYILLFLEKFPIFRKKFPTSFL